MAPDISCHLAAAGGVTHQRGVMQIEGLDDGRQIVRVAVHVVPGGSLARAAMAAPVMRDYSEALLREVMHLTIPRIGIQRPAVRKRDDRTLAPVLVVDFGAVLGSDSAHCDSSFLSERCRETLRGGAAPRAGLLLIRRTRASTCDSRRGARRLRSEMPMSLSGSRTLLCRRYVHRRTRVRGRRSAALHHGTA